MKVLNAFPPNYTAINRAFNVRGKVILFAYGDKIYNPGRMKVPPELLAHEAVHGARQGCDVEGWWRLYINDPAFRLQEEIPAHQAEYRVSGQRDAIARRLSGPLYGNLISYEKAIQHLETA